jgi:5-methylcytosine-specific restriction endonuclease McrA
MWYNIVELNIGCQSGTCNTLWRDDKDWSLTMSDIVSQKYCAACEQYFPATSEFFHKNDRAKDKLNNICKTCNTKKASFYKKQRRLLQPPKQLKTHCPKGHPLVEGNLRKGKRECLTCHRERELQRNRAKGAQPLLSGTPGRGTPDKCPQGHALTPDNIKKGTGRGCLICHRESARRRYHKDPQRMVAESSAYRKAHIEQVRERFRRYRQQESWRVRARASSMRRRARRSAAGKISLQDQRLYDDEQSRTHLESLLKDPCCYCGKPMEHIDHIVPIAKSGEEHWTNLTAACQRCNNRKCDKGLLEFLLYRLEYPDSKEGNLNG